MLSATKPLELVQLLLMENTSQDEFLDFQKRFQSFLDQSPSFLHSVGKKGFFPSFFLGAFTTLLDSGLANFDGVEVKQIYFRFNKYGDLKLAVLTEDSKTQSEKLVCIAASDNEDQEHKLKFSEEELANIVKQIFPNPGQKTQLTAVG
jgi:hypothetical protein